MDKTFERSRRSNSSWTRIEGVIRERTISDRFSRLMCKNRGGVNTPRIARRGGGEPGEPLRMAKSSRGEKVVKLLKRGAARIAYAPRGHVLDGGIGDAAICGHAAQFAAPAL